VVDPVVGFVSWDSFIENLYCPIENLQVLCKDCHNKKSLKENNKRKKANDSSKKINETA
jgi:hypothetical protein